MNKKICIPAPSNEDNLVITENLTKKEETSRFALNVKQTRQHCNKTTETFQITSSNDNAENNITTNTTSSRTQLFTSNISSRFHSNSISTTKTGDNFNTVITSSSNPSTVNLSTEKTTLCASKTAPATCRRRRPRIKLNLQPDVVGNPQCSTRMYSSSAPNSMNSKNMCMYPIDSGYASPRGYDRGTSSMKSREHGVRVLPNLYISGEDEARNPKFLKKHEIQAILTIQLHELPGDSQSEVENYKHIKIQDRPDVNISDHFCDAIQFIDENTRTLVHCQAGISRSATLCLAYLIQKQQISLETAFKQLQCKRGCIGPNFSFLGQLKTWEAHVLNSFPNKELPQRQTSTGVVSVSSTDTSPDYRKIAEK